MHDAALEWRGIKGDEWAARNPTTVEETNRSWVERYNVRKSWAVRDALRSVPAGSSWLEIGCSHGAHMRIMESAGYDVTGVDIHAGALPHAPKGRVLVGDALALPFADDAFGGVATSGTMMHLGPPARMGESIREMFRVARRWVFWIEMWNSEPMFVDFGDLAPPAWLQDWPAVVGRFFGDTWKVVYQNNYRLVMDRPGFKAPICFMLAERKDI